MSVNPAKVTSQLNNPTERANQLNDPQFENKQGYFAYDLTHSEYITPRYGEVVPSLHILTAPGDRIVARDNQKTILNQINGNLLSTINQYVDSFYIPMRSVFPMNYEKLFPNPTKGQDLPFSALPQVPLLKFLKSLLSGIREEQIVIYDVDGLEAFSGQTTDFVTTALEKFDLYQDSYPSNSDVAIMSAYISRLSLLATILSRGQLLDYLGYCFDSDMYINQKSSLQTAIDNFFRAFANLVLYTGSNMPDQMYMGSFKIQTNDNSVVVISDNTFIPKNLSEFRQVLSDVFERGEMLYVRFDFPAIDTGNWSLSENLYKSISALVIQLQRLFLTNAHTYVTQPSILDSQPTAFTDGYSFDVSRVLAYQQVIAQYYTRDAVDNIFNSDLYMQLLRGVLFPIDDTGRTNEPVFLYNGVPTEYDYITTGAWHSAFFANYVGQVNRLYIFATLFFLLRRSLRYGDYFATARPNMLAVGQLSINVDGGKVSPIDVTKNLLMQRYLNAANYIGSGFLEYMTSMYGVKPSDTGTFPRFVAHRKIELQNQITNNTADQQGKQTTNIVGFADDNAYDVFIDDHGHLLSLVSYDCLPVYSQGIDPSTHFADRFDFFNPMLQNIGDQAIRLSELTGNPKNFTKSFGYTMRNAEYKFKVSRAHGGFVNSLPAYLLKFPLYSFDVIDAQSLTINPDFIREKALYLDYIAPQNTGVSPGEYYHFAVACVNQVKCARMITATPSVLF